MSVSTNIETFAAQDAEIDLGRRNSIDRVAIDMHKARFPFDHFSLARQLVQWHAAMLFGGNHRRHLIKIAPEFFKYSTNLAFVQRRNWSLLDHFSLAILRISGDSKHKCSRVFFIFAHEQILNLCASTYGDQKQAGCYGIKCSAMANFPDLELSANQRDDVVRSHPFSLVHEKDTVRSR